MPRRFPIRKTRRPREPPDDPRGRRRRHERPRVPCENSDQGGRKRRVRAPWRGAPRSRVRRSRVKRIGVITSGGDGGGLNAVIKGVAREAAIHGVETVVIPNGYAGLYNLVDLPEVAVLDGKRLLLIDAAQAGSEAGLRGVDEEEPLAVQD